MLNLKKYFITLFDYDYHCNTLFNNMLMQHNASPQAVKIMAHLLVTQHTWLNRCKGLENPPDVQIWPAWKPVTFSPVLNQNHDDWTVYLSNLKDDQWNEIINYKTTQGIAYSDNIFNIITHVINHGTHHRAQIGQLLKSTNNMQLPPTDYIAFIRE